MKKFVFAFLVLPLCLISCSSRADRVDDFVRSKMQEQHVPGLSLAVVRNGKLLKAKGYGWANLELKVPATPRTVYHLASVTKQFLAAAILLLARDGKLQLDDKISRFLDKTPERWKDITVRQLLTHTSGIKDYLNDLHGSTQDGTSPEEIVSVVREMPLNFDPGSKWQYSNTGYLLLDVILKKITGKSYDEVLAERVFQPLGMKDTRRNNPSDIVPNRTAGYVWEGGKIKNGPYLDPTMYDNGDGGLLSTVLDLARWDAALNGDSLLTASEKQAWWSAVKLSDGSTSPYGFGWQIMEVNGHRAVYHTGNHADTSTILLRYPDDQLTVILLENRGNAHPQIIASHVAGLYLPAVMPADTPIKDTEPQVTALIKSVLVGIHDGHLDDSVFTSEAWKKIYPEDLAGFHQIFQSSGDFKSLDLLAHEEKEGKRTYRYRAVFGEDGFLISCTLTSDGKISHLEGSSE
jgi:CubicO group peptidase (beta-lactamase class C family)